MQLVRFATDEDEENNLHNFTAIAKVLLPFYAGNFIILGLMSHHVMGSTVPVRIYLMKNVDKMIHRVGSTPKHVE